MWTVEWMDGERLPIAALHGHVEGNNKQREEKEDLDGQCQGRAEGEKHRLVQDWWGDQQQKGLEESWKNFIVSSLMEERIEKEKCEIEQNEAR